jgi:hypothetical protein
MESQSTQSAPQRAKARTLEDILAEFGSIDQVIFDPIKLEAHTDAQALLPPTFSATSHPFDYFTLFFTPELFQTIATNTNRYAAIQRIHTVDKRQREWSVRVTSEGAICVYWSDYIYGDTLRARDIDVLEFGL